MLTPNCAQVSEELLKRYRRDPAKMYFTTRYSDFMMKRASTTSILSQNNKACNGTNESVKSVISLHCVTPIFFHVKCKQPTTTKMRQIFVAQKLYCACRVLSLVAIRSKYYFNYILNRTRPGRERFDRPRVYYSLSPSAVNYAYIGTVISCQPHQKIYCYIWRLFPECRIKRCLRPSVCLSVCLVASIFSTSKRRRNFKLSEYTT